MPCSDGGYGREQDSNELRRLRKFERMEPLLCSACRVLERTGFDFDENPELSEFWDKHKKEDDARVARERTVAERKKYKERIAAEAQRKPVCDLTKEEKAILKELGFLP